MKKDFHSLQKYYLSENKLIVSQCVYQRLNTPKYNFVSWYLLILLHYK